MFTRYSRMRLLRLVAKVDWQQITDGVFVTLTYPDTYADRGFQLRTSDRTLFHRHMEKITGRRIPVVWRTEWQTRRSGEYKGRLMPHHHLMLLGVKYIHYAVVNETWRSILDTSEYVRTDVRAITGSEGCGKYLCKYLAKVPSLVDGAYLDGEGIRGRQWGVMRKELIQMCAVEYDDEISEEMYKSMVATHAELDGRDAPRGYGSFSILGEIRKDKFLAALYFGLDTLKPPS